jgi:hypothetical protein
MPEYEINGKIIEYVSGIFEAKSLEEAREMAINAFNNGECMYGNTEIEVSFGREKACHSRKTCVCQTHEHV